MPELPEVETIVRDLKIKVLKRTFINTWTDARKIIKKPKDFKEFQRRIKGRKIQRVWRRGKNILLELSGNKTLLIHQKLTGHLLLGKWRREQGRWRAITSGPLTEDPMNRFLHLIFWLDDRSMLALSDLRKFAKVEMWDSNQLKESKTFKGLGPEPLEKSFTFNKFKEVLEDKKGKIKKVLMDQNIIVGIGNIYSDEILFESKIHPFKDVSKLSGVELEKIYRALRRILKRAIKLRRTSISNFRDIGGKKGYYSLSRKVYRKEGEDCPRCRKKIKRIKLGGRSAHFCPNCQRL